MRETRARNNRKSNRLLLIIIAAIIVIAAIVAVITITTGGGAVDPNDETKISVVIEEGSGTESIGETLKEKDLISSVFKFKIKSKLSGNDGNYKPGVYSLSRSQSMSEIIDVIVSGKSDVARFTIPEGYTTKQTMETLVKAGLTTEEDFMDEVVNGDFDYDFLKDVPSGDARLEGYLYPDTYEVYKNASAHDIIDTMLSNFDGRVYEIPNGKKSDMSLHEILTVASLIERETKVADERAKVASVIYNRIEKGMKLQIDASIQYILDEPKEHLLYSDLKVESPYNTYLHEGLPPGPICSPRVECVEAALNPANTNYLYYVMAPELDGHHNFSETAAEFEKNKAAYKKAIANQ